MDELRSLMLELADALANADDLEMADRALAARSESDEVLVQFVASNTVWGGAGSIADQSGGGDRNDRRLRVEAALVSLGNEQLQLGITNPRTRFWVESFERWAAEDE